LKFQFHCKSSSLQRHQQHCLVRNVSNSIKKCGKVLGNLQENFLFWIGMQESLDNEPRTFVLFNVSSNFTDNFRISIAIQVIILRNKWREKIGGAEKNMLNKLKNISTLPQQIHIKKNISTCGGAENNVGDLNKISLKNFLYLNLEKFSHGNENILCLLESWH
jgi:hypothetical protein